MVKDPVKLVLSIVLCEAVGLLGTPFTISAIPSWYQYLNKPFFSPPNSIFGPVWTILYFLMGVSLYLILTTKTNPAKRKYALTIFGVQLIINFLWSLLFFGLKSPELGFINIVALWAAIVLTIRVFYTVYRPAAYILIPYLLWVSYATILNTAIVLLN